MAGEAASALGLSMAVLAERPDDAACEVAAEVVLGSPFVGDGPPGLRRRAATSSPSTTSRSTSTSWPRLAARRAPSSGPAPTTLELAVDKAHMRTVLDEAGVPGPGLRASSTTGRTRSTRSWRFAAAHGWPVMLKAARGGYDGKGVWPVGRPGRGRRRAGAASPGQVVVEELLPLEAELAVMVARRPSGASAAWPAVETAQVGGVCREVLVPGRLAAGRRWRPPRRSARRWPRSPAASA